MTPSQIHDRAWSAYKLTDAAKLASLLGIGLALAKAILAATHVHELEAGRMAGANKLAELVDSILELRA